MSDKRQNSGVTVEEIASYVAETAARLKAICVMNGWHRMSASLEMVIVEAKRNGLASAFEHGGPDPDETLKSK